VLVSRLLWGVLRDCAGATAIEYGLLAALIALATVMVVATVGTSLSSTFQDVSSGF
jgi:pilus assembly protein Flp/PilA